MAELTCSVMDCVNNGNGRCCLPDIAVGGADARDAKETFCEDFSKVHAAGATDSTAHNVCSCPSIRCKAEDCDYNCSGSCDADNVDIRTEKKAGWPEKTECATFCCGSR